MTHTTIIGMGRYLYYKQELKASIHPLFLSLFLTLSPLPSIAEIHLPKLGDSAERLLTPNHEILLGESFLRTLRQQLTFVDDPEITAYLRTLGERLVAANGITAPAFDFVVIKDNAINAFAGPGGKIGIHTGLIAHCSNEGELAAVLAHEIAHVTQRHLMRQIERQKQLSLQGAAVTLATLAAASLNTQAAEAAIATSSGLLLQQQLNFTRTHEQEADRIGMELLYSAGYPPQRIPEFFGKLLQQARLQPQQLPEYLRTHPLELSRIADAQNRISRYSPLPSVPGEEFGMIRQRLELLEGPSPQVALRQQQHHFYSQPGMVSGYGLALAQLRAGEPEQALQQLQPLLQRNPDNPTLNLLAAGAEESSGAIEEAVARLQPLHQLFPRNLPLLQRLVGLLDRTDRSQQAVAALNVVLTHLPDNSLLYQLLARSHALLRQPVQSHLAMAQHRYLRGETQQALEQLRQADRQLSSSSENFILAATIDERRRVYLEKEKLERTLK